MEQGVLNNPLPYVLHDFMSEYKAEHKKKMKNILIELTERESYKLICEGCNIVKATHYSISPFDFICSKKCIPKFMNLLPDGCPDKSYYKTLMKEYGM